MSLQFYKKINTPAFLQNLEFNRYSIMSLGMVFQSCLAGIAVYEVLKLIPYESNLLPLAILAPICAGANALALGLAPIRWVIGGFLISILTSILIIAYAATFMI